MGAAVGRETDVVALFQALSAAPYRHDFYETLRRIECLFPDRPRWGRAPRPVDEPIRLGQDPDLSFAPAPLAAFEPPHDGVPARLQVRLFGLLGPNGPLPLHLTELTRAERRERVELLLAMVGLTDRMKHYPNELSGGQQQRVAIARALVTDPLLVIADEPTGDLDRQSAADILKLLDRLNVELGKSIVMVTHDPRAAEAAHHLIYLDKGQLTDTAPAH